MQIRLFQDKDARAVSEIIRKCLREVNSKDYPPSVIRYMCRFFTPGRMKKNSRDGTVFVAEEDNRILGTASLKDDMVLTVFVLPKHHGRGIGKRLMEKVESTAKRKGYSSVKVPASLTAVRFYRKFGYVRLKKEYNKGFGYCIMMRKRLS